VPAASHPVHLATKIFQNPALVRKIHICSSFPNHRPIFHGIASIESSKFTNLGWRDAVLALVFAHSLWPDLM